MMSEIRTDRSVTLNIDGQSRSFNIDDPVLPDWIEKSKLTSGNYPYDKRLKEEEFLVELEALQIELVKVQAWLQKTGKRVVCFFEGRDAAGKGGTIAALNANLNARFARVVALTKPSEREQGQWYFQRYIDHFPSAGEMVFFDRSWYNRAGVEPVMGFCTAQQHKRFLKDAPDLEKLLTGDGLHLFKFWLNIGREAQLERFHDRRHSPLKYWKLSDLDIAALNKWDDYTKARDLMLSKTDTPETPWTIVRANDKRRARLNVIKHLLSKLDYEGKDQSVVGEVDAKIIVSAKTLMKG
jgi:polyphosphate kinase 2